MNLSAGYFLLFIVVAFLGCVTVGLVQELAQLRARLQGITRIEPELPQGTLIPAFSWTDSWSGRPVEPSDLNGKIGLIVFLSSFCPICREVPGSLRTLLSEEPDLFIMLVCSGKPDDCKFVCKELRSAAVLVCDERAEIARQFGVSTLPTTVVVSDSLSVLKVGHSVSAREFQALLSNSLSMSATPA